MADSRFGQPGRLRSVGSCRNRLPLDCLRAPVAVGAWTGRLAARSRIGQPGGWLMPLPGADHRCLKMAVGPFDARAPAGHVPVGTLESAGTVAGRSRVSSAPCSAAARRAWRVRGPRCARLAGKASPHAGGSVRQDLFPAWGRAPAHDADEWRLGKSRATRRATDAAVAAPRPKRARASRGRHRGVTRPPRGRASTGGVALP